MQQKSRENKESRKQMNPTLQRIKATTPSKNNKSKKKKKEKRTFPPYKNRKNKTCFGKNNFGENLGNGKKLRET